ncbi:MAG: hypothetical protein WCP06_02325 [Verrucomicrobiota bacterium]
MKKTPRKIQRSSMNLGELILLVGSYSRSQRETVATVADLLETGRIRLQSHGRKFRAHVC